MMSSSAASRASVSLRLLFLGAVVTSAWAWWQFAWPVLTGSAHARHADHFGWVQAHMVGGTIMLVVGSVALYIGWTRRAFSYHKALGYTYLLGGGAGAVIGLMLSLRNAHRINGITVATGTLSIVWLAAAAMAYRAARNRRFEVHRQWMLRSYVLTWTFVGCRIAGRVPALEALGDAGGAAIVWLSWVVPLLICEFVIQWGETAAVKRAPRLG